MEPKPLINKKTLYAGTRPIHFKPGTKVKFHYVTKTCDGKGTVLDDSRSIGSPMELVLGKSFKLECWEAMVQKMSLNEVAQFVVDKSLLPQYPFIAKTLRDARKPPEQRKHCCGMTIQNEGMGYKDLNELFNNPCDLEFTMELLSAELPEDYEKDSWQLSDSEKLSTITRLRNTGNEAYKVKEYGRAEEHYRNALGMAEQLILKERPNDAEWLELIKLKMPILLNYAQCKLLDKDYYAVIEHCTEVLKHDPDNVKALYRRARGHQGAWMPDEARKDFTRCAELDEILAISIQKDLKKLAEEVRLHDLEEKLKFQKMF